jgi:transposase
MFYTKQINTIKLKEIEQKAFQLRLYKNYVSETIFEFLKDNKQLPNLFDLIKSNLTKERIKYLNNKDMEYAIKQILANYSNKIDNINNKNKNNKFFIIKSIKYTFFKKNIYSYKNKINKQNTNLEERKILNYKGDIKSKEIIKKQTNFTIILNFMFKYFHKYSLIIDKNYHIKHYNILKYDIHYHLNNNIKNNIKFYNIPYKEIKLNNKENWLLYINQIYSNKNIKTDIKIFYKNIETLLLTKNNDFIDRLFNLFQFKTYNIFEKYWKKSIYINSLSFKTQSRINKNIIGNNKNKDSIISHFINLGGFQRNNLSIPIKFHSKYHSLNNNNNSNIVEENSNIDNNLNNIDINKDKYSLKDYKQTYNITFDKIHNKFQRIELCFDEELIINNYSNLNNNDDNLNNINNISNFNKDKEVLLGIDINTKNNIFYTSNNTNYKLDTKVINSFIKLMKKVDKKKEESIYLKKQKLKQKRSLTYKINKLISILIKDSEKFGNNHLILEDIRLVGNSLKVKNKEYDIGYGRMISFIGMDTIKHKIRNICHKRNMKVSFVPSHYTSKKCNHCHYISDNNRKSQELFICEHCGLEINADYNASLNIKQILSLDVLRNEFLVFDDIFNEYNVKKYLSKLKIKNVYLKLFEEYLNNNDIKSA